MAYVLGKVKSVRKKVKFDQITDDGKPVQKADFIAELKVHDAETIKERRKQLQEYLTEVSRELAKAQKDPEHEADLPDGSFDESYIREDVITLVGILDEEGKEIPYSAELLESVLLDRRARSALISVWSELNLEDGAAKRKN